MADVRIQHNAQEQLFYAEIDGETVDAELAYSFPSQKVIDFTHTYVAEELRNQRIAENLAQTALTFARENDYKVKTSCQFMAIFVRRHPEYDDILDK